MVIIKIMHAPFHGNNFCGLLPRKLVNCELLKHQQEIDFPVLKRLMKMSVEILQGWERRYPKLFYQLIFYRIKGEIAVFLHSHFSHNTETVCPHGFFADEELRCNITR